MFILAIETDRAKSEPDYWAEVANVLRSAAFDVRQGATEGEAVAGETVGAWRLTDDTEEGQVMDDGKGHRPKDGERVRVIVEGDTRKTKDDYFEVSGYGFFRDDTAVVSVERLKPALPTTRGSLVRDGLLYLLTPKGWVDEYGTLYSVDLKFSSHPEVVYDAGAPN